MTDNSLDTSSVSTHAFRVHETCERVSHNMFVTPGNRVWGLLPYHLPPLHYRQPSVKRAFDVLCSLFLLALLAPFLLFIAILIKLESEGPILFTQIRTGQAGRSFRLYKFRSMYRDAEREGPRWAVENDPRATGIGKFLRATRLDELPQLINVLRGDMSLVGPRPERPCFNEMLSRTIPLYDHRHTVKPGITGWAQVMYQYAASEADAWQKLQFDLYYVRNYSLQLDMKIMLRTIRVMWLAEGR